MSKLQIYFIQWFPLLIFLSLMTQPHLLHFSAFSMTFIPLMFVLWLLVISNIYPVRVSKIATIFVILFVFAQLTLLMMGEIKNAGPMFLGIIWVVVALLVYSVAKQLTQYLDIFMYSFIAAALLWMIVAAIVWFGLTDGDAITYWGFAATHVAQPKPTGPFANGNVFGIMMLCAWVMTLKYWLNKKHTVLMFVLSLLFLVWVFASMSRGAWVAGIIVFLGLVIRLLYMKRYTDVLLLLLSAFVAWWVANEMVGFAVSSLNLKDRADHIITVGARLVLYPAVFEIWKEHWFLGVGLGNLTGYFLTGQALAMNYLPESIYGMGAVSSAHNHFLYMLATGGIFGLFLWLIPSYLLWKHYISNRYDITSDTWFVLSVAMVLWIQGLFNITMNEALPFFLFFMFLGLGVGPDTQSAGGTYALTIPKRSLQITIIGVVCALVMASYQTFISWDLYKRVAIGGVMGSERGKIYGKLFALENDNIYAYIMNSVVVDFMAIKKGDAQAWASIQPNIERALSLEEWPQLYQGLFYAYMLQQHWEQACKLGIFIQKQRWQHDKNTDAYKRACLGKPAKDFVLGW